jgi:hypothetical protein
MLVKTSGKSGGLFYDGKFWQTINISENSANKGFIRPYLHIYSHSSELEEMGIISLNGVSVECDPQKQSLLGV